MNLRSFDVAVIGAGPCGMAASNEVANAGLSVVLLDEQRMSGDKFHQRGVPEPSETTGPVLKASIEKRKITYLSESRMWSYHRGEVIFGSKNGAESLQAKRMLLATGAIERPMPIPGWTLPGVMSARDAPIIKKHADSPANDTVLIGSGPLLVEAAVRLLRAGCPPVALIETQTRKDFRKSLKHGFSALSGRRHLQRSLAMSTELRNANVTRYFGAQNISLLGNRVVESVHFRLGRKLVELPAKRVLLHHGLVPEGYAVKSLGVPQKWCARQNAYIALHNVWGATEIGAVWIAGDAASIGGAQVAALSGRIAGLGLAHDLGVYTRTERDQRASPLLKSRELKMKIRPFLDIAYPPFSEAMLPKDGVTVCRCGAVKARDIRIAVAEGAQRVNQVKSLSGVRGGRKHGRTCEPVVAGVLAHERGVPMDDVSDLWKPCPPEPMTVADLAQNLGTRDPTDEARYDA